MELIILRILVILLGVAIVALIARNNSLNIRLRSLTRKYKTQTIINESLFSVLIPRWEFTPQQVEAIKAICSQFLSRSLFIPRR